MDLNVYCLKMCYTLAITEVEVLNNVQFVQQSKD